MGNNLRFELLWSIGRGAGKIFVFWWLHRSGQDGVGRTTISISPTGRPAASGTDHFPSSKIWNFKPIDLFFPASQPTSITTPSHSSSRSVSALDTILDSKIVQHVREWSSFQIATFRFIWRLWVLGDVAYCDEVWV